MSQTGASQDRQKHALLDRNAGMVEQNGGCMLGNAQKGRRDVTKIMSPELN